MSRKNQKGTETPTLMEKDIYYVCEKGVAAIPVSGQRPAMVQTISEIDLQRDGPHFVAICECLEEAAQGPTEEEAIKRLTLQIELRLEGYRDLGLPELTKYLDSHGWKRTDMNGYVQQVQRSGGHRAQTLVAWGR